VDLCFLAGGGVNDDHVVVDDLPHQHSAI
jgi:hypothetical protein